MLISTEAAVPNAKRITPSMRLSVGKSLWLDGALSQLGFPRIGHQPIPDVVRFPQRLSRESFYAVAYPLMFLSRRMDERMVELFKKGYVKGTVTTGVGNEATTLGMTLPLRPGRDVVSIMHRDLLGHLLLGATPQELFCQYMANAESITHAREGNVHHGDAANRRFPMISHLGKMPSLVVGGTWAAHRQGEDVFGLSVLGDGGSSTGEFHESLNLAAIHKVPVLFVIENNYYSFSTPITAQYTCANISDRAKGFGIVGRTIDGTDAWVVYSAVCDVLEAMHADSRPQLLECRTLRLQGHAVYDNCEYVPDELIEKWRAQDPLPVARRKLQEMCGFSDDAITTIESRVEEEIQEALNAALRVARPDPARQNWSVFAPSSWEGEAPAQPQEGRHISATGTARQEPRLSAITQPSLEPFHVPMVKNGEAVKKALEYLLSHNPEAFLMGLDIGSYGSAFKTCKGLIDRFGPQRVIDMPLCEPALMGFALGASQLGQKPIFEFQFADFSTETATQLGMNVGTWYFRTGCPAPILVRLPCGGGLTMGCFHSGEFEGLWSRFPGLKMLYPTTAQETFEALVAGFYDPNPCLVFEHKLLYWSKSGPIDFDGDTAHVWRPRQYREGTDLTVVAFGAMVYEALAAAQKADKSLEVWNPFVLSPLPLGPIVESVRKTGRLLVVQECGATQGLGEMVISRITREAFSALKSPPQLVAAPDMPIPFAPELESYYRPNAEKLLTTIEKMF